MYLELLQKSVLPLLGTFLTLLGGWWIREEWKILGNPADGAFKTRMESLLGPDGKGRNYSAGYRTQLQRFLLWIDKYFGALPPSDKNDVKVLEQIRLSLSVSSFERLLQLAVSYPILFVITAWLFTGKGELGGITMLLPTDFAMRVLVVLMMVLATYSYFRLFGSDGWSRYFWLVVAVAVVAAVVVVAAVAVAPAFAPAFALAPAFAFAVAGAVAGAVAVAFAGAGAVAVTGAFAGAFAGAGAVAVTGAVFVASFAIQRRAESAGYLALFYVAFYLFAALYFSLSVWLMISYGKSHSDGFTILLFIGVLPLLNAPLDWLSFGITRGLLQSIASRGHGAGLALLWAAADVILALIFLLLVAVSTWTGVWLMNQVAVWAGGAVILDMTSLLKQLRNDGWRENLWIWMMLGSTLIPTAIHFLIASMAGFLAFNRAKAVATAGKMQLALDKVAKQKGEADKEAAVGVDSDARRSAFIYLYGAPAAAVTLWAVMTVSVSMVFLHWVPAQVEWFLSLVW